VGWIKSNLVIVVCLIVTIGAPTALWYVSSGWNAEVQREVNDRGRQLDALAGAGKAEFSWPASVASERVMVTPDIVAAYEKRAQLLSSQADAIVTQATALNAEGFENPFPELLPFPQPDQWPSWTPQKRQAELAESLQVLPAHLHGRLMTLYDGLLDQVNAGVPPDPTIVRERLASVHDSFAEAHASDETLTEEERKGLAEKLGVERLALYEERANEIGMYLTLDTLGPPPFASTDIPDHETIARWMWRYWVMQRLMEAIRGANLGLPETGAAIKRIDRIDVRGLMALDTPLAAGRQFNRNTGGSSGGRSGGAPGGGPPRGGPPRGGPPGVGPPGGGPPGGGPPGGGPKGSPGGGHGASDGGHTGPTAPPAGTIDRTKSISGRASNALYDVVLLDLDMVVATDRIDEVLEAFSLPIKTTVLDVVYAPVNGFLALEEGYFYGAGSVSRLTLTVETLWLRAWTKAFLPDSVRTALGFPARSFEPAGGGDTTDQDGFPG
jgi:hypothetical protein